MKADIIFLSAISLAVAVGLFHRWLTYIRSERDRKRRLDAITGRRE